MKDLKGYVGDLKIIQKPKTAFLCSRLIPASIVLKCYDWAIEQRENGNCIISGFQSQIEKDVFHYLLKGKQPIIVVLARGLKQKYDPLIQQAIELNRLLIITPFGKEVIRVTEKTAQIRNQFMIDLADQIVIGHINTGGLLEDLLENIDKKIIRMV
jgi:predicted Rossmann fold nucleotide-binding protein DprA/Smf involved in DNA uptake